MPDTQKGRPVQNGPSTHNNPRPTVLLPTDDWAIIARGWAACGVLPVLGSPAWRTLPDDDAVKVAVVVATRLGVRELVNRHGPSYARWAVVNELEAA